MKIIGMMSGTSGDGIDAVVLELEGAPPSLKWSLLKHIHLPFPPELQAEIFACFNPKSSGADRLCAVNFALGETYARAALAVIDAASLAPQDIALIGNHGQSFWHIPSGPQASTFQLGDASVIAERTGITTISNFRTRDMAAGGQGAPLVAYIDVLLFSHPEKTRVLQNIGGIANSSYLPSKARAAQGEIPFAFDNGPGNMLIDDAIRRISGGKLIFDEGGQTAARGKVHPGLLQHWIESEQYFRLPPPKTTGRELFGEQYGATLWADAQRRSLSHEDFAATITAFTAHSIVESFRQFMPSLPEEVIVSGGGAYNHTLLAMMQELLPTAAIQTIDRLGMPSDAKEAAAFAVLAYETWHNRPGNLPAATGARHPVVLGSITPGLSFHGG